MRTTSLILFAIVALVGLYATCGTAAEPATGNPFQRLAVKVQNGAVLVEETARLSEDGEEAEEEAAEDGAEESEEDEEAAEEPAEDGADESAEAEEPEESADDASDEASEANEAAAETEEAAAGAAEEADERAKQAEDDAAKQAAENADLKAKLAADEARINEDKNQVAQADQAAAAGNAAAENQNREEIQGVRDQAEAAAKATVEAATRQAQDILAKAKTKANDCGSRCGETQEDEDKKDGWTDAVLLAPRSAADEIDNHKLGLWSGMEVSTPIIHNAGVIAKRADEAHDKFIDSHEKDCQGSICPGNDFKVSQ